MATTRSTRTIMFVVAAAVPALAEAAPGEALDPDDGYYAYADVVDVSPRYGWHELSEPVRHCVDVAEDPGPGGWRYAGHHRYHDRYDDREHGRQRHPHRRTQGEGAASVVGGLIGGLIGHQFGGGNGKTALTIVGAALGASAARDHVRRQHEDVRYYPSDRYADAAYPRSVVRCTQSQRTRRVRGVNGYDVTYRYQGATFHKWVDAHPGDVVRVRVAVEPLAAGPRGW